MSRLAWLASVALLTSAVADLASATTYVPGQVRDGVYIRPHFVGVDAAVPDGRFASPVDRRAAEPKPPPGAELLGPQVAPSARTADAS